MLASINRLHVAGLLLVCSCVIALVPRSSMAQLRATAPKSLDKEIRLEATSATMDDVLASLSVQSHLDVIVDGEPIAGKTDFMFNGTIGNALDKIADKFDYTWSLSKTGAVLMSKRFNNPKERPQVNLPEMVEMTRSILRTLDLIEYDKDESHWPLVVKLVAQTFSPEQKGVLEAGKRLSGSDLFPAQQIALRQAILSNTFASAFHLWEGLLPNLEAMPISRLQAKKHDSVAQSVNVPAYDFFYVFRRPTGQLHVFELPHIVYGNGDETVVTP